MDFLRSPAIRIFPFLQGIKKLGPRDSRFVDDSWFSQCDWTSLRLCDILWGIPGSQIQDLSWKSSVLSDQPPSLQPLPWFSKIVFVPSRTDGGFFRIGSPMEGTMMTQQRIAAAYVESQMRSMVLSHIDLHRTPNPISQWNVGKYDPAPYASHLSACWFGSVHFSVSAMPSIRFLSPHCSWSFRMLHPLSMWGPLVMSGLVYVAPSKQIVRKLPNQPIREWNCSYLSTNLAIPWGPHIVQISRFSPMCN